MHVSRRASGVGAGARGNHENLRGLRVLHVDDSRAVLDAVALRLAPQGVRLTSTPDPREALRMLTAGRRSRVDLLITDLVMPDMDGIALINAALAARRLPRTLVLSGSQGGPQIVQMLHELGSPTWAGISLPIRYLKKEPDSFDDALLHHLHALRGTSLRCRAHIRNQVLPHLSSVIEPRAVGPEIPTETRRRHLFETMLDRYLDHRFTIMLDADLFIADVAAAVQTHDDDDVRRMMAQIHRGWQQAPRPRREEILHFDRFGWHNFKGDAGVYINLLDVLERWVLDPLTLPDLRTSATVLEARFLALSQLERDLTELRKVGREQREQIDVLATLRRRVALDAPRAVVPIRGDIPEGVLELDLPTSYVANVYDQLYLKAREVMLAAGLMGDDVFMTLRSSIVPASAWASALHVTPEADDELGARYRPTMDASRYWYFGLLNPGASIPPEVRAKMLAGTFVTTKEHGTSMGMTFIHELLREQRGSWLSVESRGGWTEIGVFTPIPDGE